MSYMKQNKKHKQTLESAQYGLKIIFKVFIGRHFFYFELLSVSALSKTY